MTPLSQPHQSTASLSSQDATISTQKPLPRPCSLCADPIHYHSFAKVSVISSILRSYKKCIACGESLSSWSLFRGSSGNSDVNGGSTGDDEAVSCLACGVYAHRKCVFRKKSMPICQVNYKLIQERERYSQKCLVDAHNSADKNRKHQQSQNDPVLVESPKKHSCEDIESFEENDDSNIWSDNGPPIHWALSDPTTLKGLKPDDIPNDAPGMSSSTVDENDSSSSSNSSIIHHKNQNDASNDESLSFGRVSKALQEHLFVHLNRNTKNELSTKQIPEDTIRHTDKLHEDTNPSIIVSKSLSSDHSSCNNGSHKQTAMSPLSHTSSQDENDVDDKLLMEESIAVVETIAEQMKQISSFDDNMGTANTSFSSPDSCVANNLSQIDDCMKTQNDDDTTASTKNMNPECNSMDKLLEVKEAKPPPPIKQRKVIQNIYRTIEIAKKTSQSRKALGIASVAGGLAGGVAGLVIAGPAGAYVGLKLGQVAGMAGVVVEGTLLVAGVAGTVFTVNQLKNGNRFLKIDDKVLIVRPNIVVDPIWEDIAASARRSAPKDGPGFMRAHRKVGKRERMKRDKDIIDSDETEITTCDKVSLLVFSSLNDKTSLPGHIYRELIKEHHSRIRKRSNEKADDHDVGTERMVRDDVHAIIKHVTGTLLEIRPGFSASRRITEISAVAVETIVFGEVYTAVFDEIVTETRETDNFLNHKISNFQIERAKKKTRGLKNEDITAPLDSEDIISVDALKALRMLPESYSVAEKLMCCVKFLETISSQFSTVGADSLLKMVCQHIVAAKVPNMNAEIVFLEEFARDEQLLRGREGYALVTMQASLHFMNASSDFDNDLFHNDEG